jgi:hypothetical protein
VCEAVSRREKEKEKEREKERMRRKRETDVVVDWMAGTREMMVLGVLFNKFCKRKPR